MSPVTGLVLLLAFSYVSNSPLKEPNKENKVAPRALPAVLSRYCPVSAYSEACTRDVTFPDFAECFGDEGCRNDEKCCRDECGKIKCLSPVVAKPVEKPGRCPIYNDSEPVMCTALFTFPECFGDEACPKDQKCCSDRCGRVKCTPPVIVQPVVKPGSCPVYNFSEPIFCTMEISLQQCLGDEDCPKDQKCCGDECGIIKCTPPDLMKPGQCPAPKKNCYGIASVTQCKNDNNCLGKKKCCDQCGRKCVTPEQEHAGRCPTSHKNLPCFNPRKTLCTRDSECSLDQKCCLSNSIKQCLVAQSVNEKQCPVVNTLVKCKQPYPRDCKSDAECGRNQKCCDSGCRFSCVEV